MRCVKPLPPLERLQELFEYVPETGALLWRVRNDVPPEIDHKDGNRRNNHHDNLRDGSGGINNRNSAKSSANKSGFCGVSFNKERQMWHSYIRADRRQKYLGHFPTIEAAAEARAQAAIELGYSARHGQPKELSK